MSCGTGSSSFFIFDSTSGMLTAMVPNISPESHFGGCLAGLCITWVTNRVNTIFTAQNYMTGSLSWNVTVPTTMQDSSWSITMTYIRSTLILVTCRTNYGNPSAVITIDPTSGKYELQPVGKYMTYFLQQRGSTQVLVWADQTLVLANV